MASQSQFTANRENAQHSTGPKTSEGKAKVAQNRTTHGLLGHTAVIPGEDLAQFQSLALRLQVELAPATAVEETLVATIAITQWRTTRIANWVTELTTEALSSEALSSEALSSEALSSEALSSEALAADPAFPSRLMKMFSKAGDPSEALARLHRLEAANLRQWHNALKELRLSKETRNRAETGQNPTAYNDIVRSVESIRAFCEDRGLPPKPVDDSNPIPPPDALPDAPGTPPLVAADPDVPTPAVISRQ